MFGLPALLIYALFTHGMMILLEQTDLPGVSPLIPSTRGGNLGVAFPGYDIFIPWWHALIAIIITLVAHESSHGVLTRVAKVRLKSTGILTLGSLPIGAFVEPDEEELNRHTSIERMRVYTMGSFANFVVGITFAIMIFAIYSAFSSYMIIDGVKVVGFIEGFPAKEVMESGSLIYSIDGTNVADMDEFVVASKDLVAGEKVVLNTSSGVHSFTLGVSKEDPGKGYMGVYVANQVSLKGSLAFIEMRTLSFIIDMLEWIVFFNINIGLVNLLPIIPFDGGRMFHEVINSMKIKEINVKRVVYAVIVFTAIVFMVNTLPLFSMIITYGYKMLGLM